MYPLYSNLDLDILFAIAFVIVCATFLCYLLMPVAQNTCARP